MKVDGWICRECMLLFIEPHPGHDVRDYDGSIIEEQPSTCPFCGSPEIQYGYYECEACGEDFLDEAMESDEYCKGCAEKAWKALDEYLVNDIPMSAEDKEIIKVLKEEL